jgi:hypothetical protein
MKKLAALTATIAIALAVGGITAAAADDGYHANGNSCDAGHGAFGAFSHHDAFDGGINWRSVDAREDGGLGHDTGPTNSGFSATCNG